MECSPVKGADLSNYSPLLGAQEQKCPLQTNKNLLIGNLFDRERQKL